MKYVLLLLLLPIPIQFVHAQTIDSIPSVQLDSVVFIGAAPLPGSGIPSSKTSTIVHQIGQRQLSAVSNQFSLDHVERHIGAVHFYKASGNDRQVSLNYRGFQAAPLLGLSQGLAVYMDGIRMNDVFGDVVYWEMIPINGLKKMELAAGSNPIFGLNTLGGALQFTSKSGFDHDKNSITSQIGNYGYKSLDLEWGIQKGKWAYYLTGNGYDDNGWRDFSPSKSGQIFSKVSRKTDKSTTHFTYQFAKSDFLGNGAIPVELLDQQRNSVFTHPDRTENNMHLFSFHHTYALSKNQSFQTLVYYKSRNIQTFNGDDSSYEECEGEHEGFMCTEDEDGEEAEVVIDQNGLPILVSESVSSAVNNRTTTQQNSLAIALQYQSKGKLFNLANRFIAGQRLETGRSEFDASTELAMLTPTRGTIGSGFFDREQFTDVHINVLHWSAFFADWIDLFDHRLTVQTAARINYSTIQLRDQIGTALNGDHSYLRLNPSLGIVWNFKNEQQLFSNFSISNRTPTPVELTCADPDDPCRLPNSFLADPPLDAVISSTFEIGWKGKYNWGRIQGVGFHSTVINDIYFVSAGPARNSGYFTNLSNTIRKGFEFEYSLHQMKWDIAVSANYMKAEFNDEFVMPSAEHPLAIEGETIVEKGDRMPLVPTHSFKVYGNYEFMKNARIGLLWNYHGDQIIRGDESNTLDYRLPSFHFINVDAKYQLSEHFTTFLEIKNLLNLEYNTFALLGEPDEIEEFEDFENPIFLTPNPPRLIRVGLRFSWQ
ncbi:MAG: TonB-dependent receptor [Saprospiraceae bacterium]|nr:TonB-dependent receptor [Saprospiraceae bacterium]